MPSRLRICSEEIPEILARNSTTSEGGNEFLNFSTRTLFTISEARAYIAYEVTTSICVENGEIFLAKNKGLLYMPFPRTENPFFMFSISTRLISNRGYSKGKGKIPICSLLCQHGHFTCHKILCPVLDPQI